MRRLLSDPPPAWGLFALLLCLPLLAGGNELYSLSPSTALLAVHVLVLLLMIAWWVMRLERWQWAKVPPRIAAAAAVFFVISIAATASSAAPYQSELKLMQTAIGLILAYAAADLLRTEQALRRAAWAILWGGAVVAVYGIEQGIFGLPNWLIQAQTNRASQDLVEMVSQGRVFSTFANVNAFAAYLAMVLPIGGYLLLRAERIGSQALAGGLLLTVVMALAMTGSKGGWGAALIVTAGLVAVAAFRGDWRRLVKRMGLVFLASFLLAGFVWSTQPGEIENPMERFFAVTMGLKQSAEGRWSYWQGAVKIIEAHPLLGTGPGTFGFSFQQVQHDGHYARYAHNLYLQMAGEIGIAGLLAFLAVTGLLGMLALRLRAQRELGRVLLLSAGALLLHGLVDFSWELPANQWLFFLLCGMIIGADRIGRHAHRQAGGETEPADSSLSQRRRAMATLATVPAAVLLLALIGRPYFAEGYLQSAIAASIADDTEQAIDLGTEAVRHAPRSARAANFLATAYRRQWEKSGEPDWLTRAADRHRAAIDLAPAVGLYHDELGSTRWAMAQPEAAVAAWQAAHDRYPINPDFAVHLGRGLWLTGRPEEALRVLGRAAKSEPLFLAAGSPELLPFYDLHFLMAKIYDESGDLEAAFAEYGRILNLADRSPERIAYGPLLAGRIAIQPKLWYAPRSHLEMGDLHQRQGRSEQALAAYRRAVEMDGNYAKAKQRLLALEARLNTAAGL
ncbi:MAG: O-antigen ligase family protein [Nitrospirota bacterium]